MPTSDDLSVEQMQKLSNELTKLSQQQSRALQATAYIKMSPEEALEYDQRRLRIAEILTLLEKFKRHRLGEEGYNEFTT